MKSVEVFFIGLGEYKHIEELKGRKNEFLKIAMGCGNLFKGKKL